MVEIKEISYKDERLGFFADQRKLVQKRYDRLEKQIKPDEPYTSERREFLSDLGRELSFYNDVIEMLENDVVPKSKEGAECPTCHGTGRIGTTDWLTKNISKKQLAEEKAKAIAEHEQHIKSEYANKIFEDICRIGGCSDGIRLNHWDVAELKKKYE